MLTRLATTQDADQITEVLVRARERMPFFLEDGQEEIRAQMRVVLGDREVWVIEREQRILGFLALRDQEIEHLYVHPLAQRFGIGSALLERAKASRPSGLKTRVFQKDAGARRFCELRGFDLVSHGEVSANEEQEPDLLYEWKPLSKSAG